MKEAEADKSLQFTPPPWTCVSEDQSLVMFSAGSARAGRGWDLWLGVGYEGRLKGIEKSQVWGRHKGTDRVPDVSLSV